MTPSTPSPLGDAGMAPAGEIPVPAAPIADAVDAADPQAREQRIRERAFRKYEARGGAPGDAEHDWLEAEQEVGAEDGAQAP